MLKYCKIDEKLYHTCSIIPKYTCIVYVKFVTINHNNYITIEDKISGNIITKEYVSNSSLKNTTLLCYVCKNVDKDDVYIVIDIMYYKNTYYKNILYDQKYKMIVKILHDTTLLSCTIVLYLPCIYSTKNIDYHDIITVPYAIDYIQFQPIYYNLQCITLTTSQLYKLHTNYIVEKKNNSIVDTNTLQKKYKIFLVKPQIQSDIYYLYTYDTFKNQYIYDSIASVMTYKTSNMLNVLFRNYKESKTLDWIADTDTNTNIENTTFMNCYMNCIYNIKFRKWIPLYVIK
jgi:hypothetical protein